MLLDETIQAGGTIDSWNDSVADMSSSCERGSEGGTVGENEGGSSVYDCVRSVALKL